MIRKRAVSSSRKKKESHRFLLEDSPSSSYQEDEFLAGLIDTPVLDDPLQIRFEVDSAQSMRKKGTSAGSAVSSSSSISSKGLKKMFGNRKAVDNFYLSSAKVKEKVDDNSYFSSMDSLNRTSEETVNKSSSIDDMKSCSCDKASEISQNSIMTPKVKQRSVSPTSENGSVSRGRGRVARIAQMFSSRAAVNGKKEKNVQGFTSSLSEKKSANLQILLNRQKKSADVQNIIPQNKQEIPFTLQTTSFKQPEAAHPPSATAKLSTSSVSSSDTGWPGTQNGRGQTVLVKDDDETLTFATFEDEEQDRAANEEMKLWVGEDDDTCDMLISDTDSASNRLEETEVEENAADYHLAAAIAEAMKSSAGHLQNSYNTLEKHQDVQSVARNHYLQPFPKTAKFATAKSDTAAICKDRNIFSSTNTNVVSPSRSVHSSTNQSVITDTKGTGGTLSIKDLFNSPDKSIQGPNDPWDIDSSILESSSARDSATPTSVSKTSSAYSFTSNNISPNEDLVIDLTESKNRVLSSGRALTTRHQIDTHITPAMIQNPNSLSASNHALSAENVAAQNHLTPQPKPINGASTRGYRPFIDKAVDVPNLMDYEESTVMGGSSECNTTTPLENQVIQRKGSKSEYAESDIFDGLSACTPGTLPRQQDNFKTSESDIFDGIEYAEDNIHIVTPENRLKIVPAHGFAHENTFLKSNILPPLTPSLNGRSNISNPSSPRVATKKNDPNSLHFATETETSSIGSYNDDSDSSDNDENDLSIYYVQPILIRKLVRAFRKFCRYEKKSSYIDKEDAKKAFALFEMRSRVMETDIERGLCRQGGTVAVDDIVLTSAYRTTMRIRDALIVSKAWRDGASPRDALTAALLTRRSTHCYKIRRAVYKRVNNDRSFSSNASVYSHATDHSQFMVHQYFEEVRWVDDIDVLLLKCPSLGPRNLRGFEMFTVGDCQSLLLKLTNEQCNKLQKELSDATERQIEAEELMNEEVRSGFDSGFEEDFMMTKAEMEYLNAMDEVKTISKSLVIAEKSFKAVRDRIERLVAEYEAALIEIEEESSEVDNAYSSDSADDNYESNDEEEQEVLSRRAQKAELRAEVAAREALLAKEEVHKVKEQKEQEIQELQQRLSELESKTSVERERAANMITEYERQLNLDGRSVSDLDVAKSISPKILDIKLKKETEVDAKERVKAKFRSRRAERATSKPMFDKSTPLYAIREKAPTNPNVQSFKNNLNGEEMYQRLDFYERSLQSISMNQSRHEIAS